MEYLRFAEMLVYSDVQDSFGEPFTILTLPPQSTEANFNFLINFDPSLLGTIHTPKISDVASHLSLLRANRSPSGVV